MMAEPLKQVKDENVSDLPYHNKATEKIAAERAKPKAEPVKAPAAPVTPAV